MTIQNFWIKAKHEDEIGIWYLNITKDAKEGHVGGKVPEASEDGVPKKAERATSGVAMQTENLAVNFPQRFTSASNHSEKRQHNYYH